MAAQSKLLAGVLSTCTEIFASREPTKKARFGRQVSSVPTYILHVSVGVLLFCGHGEVEQGIRVAYCVYARRVYVTYHATPVDDTSMLFLT
jgi:hypothetical protein